MTNTKLLRLRQEYVDTLKANSNPYFTNRQSSKVHYSLKANIALIDMLLQKDICEGEKEEREE